MSPFRNTGFKRTKEVASALTNIMKRILSIFLALMIGLLSLSASEATPARKTSQKKATPTAVRKSASKTKSKARRAVRRKKAPVAPAAAALPAAAAAATAAESASTNMESSVLPHHPSTVIHKVLFIGDSMTGWMAERLNAYGKGNGFEVAAVIWDGSTIRKWGTSDRLRDFIIQQKPDAIFISLGLNELFVRNPESSLKACVERILKNIGEIPYLWIGPPTWPGKPGGQTLNAWLEKTLGPKHFFNSSALTLPRQSATNPHPSRAGINTWMDAVAAWIPAHTGLSFPSLSKPSTSYSRPGYYLYRRMRETL